MKSNANLDNLQLANIVTKDSKSGLSANKRLLVLKTGHLYYYSDIPKSFNGDIKSLESKDDNIPKCSIQISNILSIKGDFRTPLQFEIQFEARHMLQKQDIRKTITLEQFNFAPKNTTQMIKWKFTCQSREIRDKWIQSLKNLKQYFSREKVNIQKFFKTLGKQSNSEQIYSPRKSTKVPWKTSQQQKKLEQQKIKNLAAQQLKKKKKIQEQQKKQKQRKKKQEEQKLKKEEEQRKKQKQFQQQQQKQKKMLQQIQNKRHIQQQQQLKKNQQQRQKEIQEQQQKNRLKQQMQIIKKRQNQNQAQLQKRLTELSMNNQFENKRDQQDDEIKIKITQPKNQQKIQQQNPNLDFVNQYNNQSQSLQSFITSTKFYSDNFKQKIGLQKDFYVSYSNFRDKCAIHFQQIVDELVIQQSKRRYKILPTKIISIQDIIFKIGMTYSRSITINNSSKYFYDESEIKNLKREFQTYNILQIRINKELKQKKEVKIRVPIVCFIEYKGVACLAFKQNNQQKIIQQIDQQIQSQLKKFEISSQNVILKKTYNNCLTIYVKNPFKIKKTRSLTFQSPLTPEFLRIAERDRVSTSIKNLKNHKQKLNQLKRSPQNQQIKQGLQMAIFCKYIRKLYRSAQGQIQQQNFWNLILKKDKSMISMIKSQGCQKIPEYKTILFTYIKYYFQTTFELSNPTDPFSPKFPIKSLNIKPITYIFKISHSEIQQSINNFDKYLKQGRVSLAQQSFHIKEQIFQSKFSPDTYVKNIIDKALLLQLQNDVIQSIKQCKRALELLHYHDIKKFDIFAILLKNYEYSENQMMQIFKNWSELIYSNYGKDHYSLISLYCIMAHFFGFNKQNIKTGLKLYNLSLDLCTRLYGIHSIQSGNIYLDISKMYKHNNKLNQAFEYLEKSRKIYLNFGQNTIQFTKLLTYSSILYNLKNDTIKAQEAIQLAFQFLQKSNTNDIQALIQAYKIGFYIYDEKNLIKNAIQIIQKIWCISEYYSQHYKTTFQLTFKFILKKLKKQDLQIFQQLTNKASQLKLSQSFNIQNIKKLKKGYPNFHSFIQEIVFTLIDNKNYGNGQFQILYEAYVHILHYVDSHLIIGLIQALK